MDDGTGSYDAPDTGKSIALALKALDGPSKDQGPTVNITIVEPSSAFIQKFSGIKHNVDTWSCGFLGNIYVGPSDVSFYNLSFYEGGANAVTSGWLAEFNVPHPQSSSQHRIGSDNGVNEQDEINSGQKSGPYGVGFWYWDIPWHVTTNSNRDIAFMTARQLATSDTAGKCVISKGGAAVSRVPSDPTSVY